MQPLAKKPAKKVKTTHEKSHEEVAPVAGPSKQLQEFMDVMKGQEGAVPGSSGVAVPGDQGWVADGKGKEKKEKSKKGKEKADEEEEVDAAEDDDAAWFRKRQNAALEEAGVPVPRVSTSNLPY